MGRQQRTICPWCGRPTIVVYVHGEGRCQLCHNVIEPCCEGECATPPADDSADQKPTGSQKSTGGQRNGGSTSR